LKFDQIEPKTSFKRKKAFNQPTKAFLGGRNNISKEVRKKRGANLGSIAFLISGFKRAF